MAHTLKHSKVKRIKKSELKGKRKSLKGKRRSLRNKRKTLTHRRRKLHKRKTKRKHNKKQRGGNEPIISSATWKTQEPYFLPPGGMYVNGCSENGLNGGYYYGVQTCTEPLPESTIGHPDNLSSIQQKGGNVYTSLGGLKGLARQSIDSIRNIISTYKTSDPPVDPNPTEQPINHIFHSKPEVH
jgi:hypothetical protein